MKLLLSTLLAAGAMSAVAFAAAPHASAQSYRYYGANEDSYRQYCRDEWYYRRYESYCSRYDRDNDGDYDDNDYDAYDNNAYDDDEDYYGSYYDGAYDYGPDYDYGTYGTYDHGRRHHPRDSNYNYNRSDRYNSYDRNDRDDGYDRSDRTNTRGTTRVNPSWGEGSTSNNSGSRYMNEGRDQAPENTDEDTVPGRTQGNTGDEGQGNDSNSYTGQRSTTH
jgi:hypothetical protein